MSRDSAKAHYTKQPGDPDEGFITASDAQAAIDDIYDDMSAPAVIADGSVTSGKIAADAVGSAQIATGAVGSGELATDAVTSDKIADGAVSNAHVASDAAIAASKVAGTAVTQADTGTVTNGMLAGSIAKTKVAGTAITAADTGTVTGTMIAAGAVDNGNLAANAVNEAKIASGAVTTVKIADDAVTSDKIADNAVTAAQIAANAVGASELADNAVDTAAIAADAVTADKIANDTITAAELAANSVGTSELANDSVTAAKILDGTITANEIQNASITGAKLVNDTITATQIAANAVDTAALQDGAVTTAKVADGAVSAAKMDVTDDSRNQGIGESVQPNLTTGGENTAFGWAAQWATSSGGRNTAYGSAAQYSLTTGNYNTALGCDAQRRITTGPRNTAVGQSAQQNLTTGSENTAMGDSAQSSLGTGEHNTAFGSATQWALTTGIYNTAIGRAAQYALTTGNGNTSLGFAAGQALTTGSFNTAIGAGVHYSGDGTLSGTVAIGTDSSGTAAEVTANNQFVLGTALHTVTVPGKLTGPQIVPRIILPTDISAVVGDTLQIFKRGVVEAADPYALPVKLASTVGADLPRMFEWTPEAGDTGTTKTLTVTAQGFDQSTLATGSTSIVVKTAANPASMKRIVAIGDSVTNGMAWPEEAYRRLTQTGGTPAGKGFTNFEFVGDQAFPNFGTQGGFGHSGWRWDEYITAGSPFWISSALTVKGWIDANAGGTAPDLFLIHLGWNGLAASAVASGHAATVTAGKVLVDKIHSEYPSAKVVLIGLQVPPLNGALSIESPTGQYAHHYDLARYANGLNLAYAAWAAEAGYSSWMRYVSLAAQFDSDYNYNDQVETVAVNTRSNVTESRGTNTIHPGSHGRLQIADVAYREIVRAFA